MINLDKINSQFDINNIDPAQITKLILEQQKIIIIVFIVGALLMAGVFFNDHHGKEVALAAKVSQEQGKMAIIKARSDAIQDLSDFKSSIPKPINVFDLITLISNYAKDCNTNIVSYSPIPNRDMGLYDITNVGFTVTSDNFKDMMIFLRKIEKSNSPIMINSWAGHQGDGGSVSFNIVISAVIIHP